VTIFSLEVQRRVRLRNAKKFDLSEVLGEPIVIFIGELPQVHQTRVVAFLEIRRELLESAAAAPKEGEEKEAALKRLGADLQGTEVQALDAASRVGKELTKKLHDVMQELIAGALLDANGDRMSDEDGRALFSLLPASREVAHLMNEMSEAVLSRIGGAKKAAAADAAAQSAPAEPVGK
jgi:hypothetical protein